MRPYPDGKSKGGYQATSVRDLSATIRAIRNPAINPKEIEDRLGLYSKLEQGSDRSYGRHSRRCIPFVSGQTVNRLCGSSMSALHNAANLIQTGNGISLSVVVWSIWDIPMTMVLIIRTRTRNRKGCGFDVTAGFPQFNGVQRQAEELLNLMSKQPTQTVSLIPEGHDSDGFCSSRS